MEILSKSFIMAFVKFSGTDVPVFQLLVPIDGAKLKIIITFY